MLDFMTGGMIAALVIKNTLCIVAEIITMVGVCFFENAYKRIDFMARQAAAAAAQQAAQNPITVQINS